MVAQFGWLLDLRERVIRYRISPTSSRRFKKMVENVGSNRGFPLLGKIGLLLHSYQIVSLIIFHAL